MGIIALEATQPDDVEAFRTIRLRALATDPDAFGQTLENAAEYDTATWTSRVAGYRGRPGRIFINRTDDLEVGVVGVGLAADPSDVEIWGMWVAPEARGAGVGSSLLTATADWALMAGANTMTLWVMRTNVGAARLYEHTGFEPFEPLNRVGDTPEGCDDELCMRLVLPNQYDAAP